MPLLNHHGQPLVRVERRDPSGATRPVTFQAVNRPMVAAWDAMSAVERGYYGTPYLARALQVRANALAGLPIRAGADPDKPASHNPNAAILRFLKGNPQVSLNQLLLHAMLQRDLTGRYAWEVELDTAHRPFRAWPLMSAYLDPVPSEGGGYYWRRFEYRVANQPSQVIYYEADQVHYDWRPSQLDYRQPESLLQPMRLPLSVLVAQDIYNFAFLQNGGVPSYILAHEEFADDDDEAAFRQQFNSEYGGPKNAGKTMFVEATGEQGAKGAIEVTPVGLSQRDARAVEIYQAAIRAVSVGTGVPMSKLGDSSERTFSNADQEDVNFWEMMVDEGRALVDGINRELARRLGPEVLWFDFSEVEALQRKSRFAQPSLIDATGRFVSPNEARQEVGLPPVQGGDELVPEEAPRSPDQIPPAQPALGARPQEGPPPEAQPQAKEGQPATGRGSAPGKSEGSLGQSAAHHPRPESRVRDPELRVRLWRQADQQMGVLERSWERQLRAYFARQEAATVDRLSKQRRGKQFLRDATGEAELREAIVVRVFDPRFWAEQAVAFLLDLYETAADMGRSRITDRFDRDPGPADVAGFIRGRANWLAGQINNTTHQAIQDQLVEGVAEGEGVDKLSARVREVFADANQTRAETIARTEVLAAYHQAGDQAVRALGPGVAAGKEWIATLSDTRTRDDHRHADGQIVGIGRPFRVGAALIEYPGQPTAPLDQIIRCRCTVGYLTPSEMAERSSRKIELRDALRLVDLVAEGLVTDIRRAVEVAA